MANKNADVDDAGNATSHYKNSESAMKLANTVWGSVDSANAAKAKQPCFKLPATSVDKALAAATASQRREKSLAASLEAHEKFAKFSALTSATADDVRTWLRQLKVKRDKKGRLIANPMQFEAVHMVAQRVIKELEAADDVEPDLGDPLRWCVHGGPGTGKSHVIKLVKEMFTDVLQWNIGVEFQIVALQAVMADLLGGDTIHHACGIPVCKREECHGDDAQKQMEVAKRVLQWRWLIIDEISMVSAKLLADVDMKMRQVVRVIGTNKKDGACIDRPFGGLNVICCGDFWQLDPPDGGFLADIPTEWIQRGRQFKAAPTIAHGQSLLWSGGKHGMQGVTELVECERCDDAWLREVQEEFRNGRLSVNNHAFLHGRLITFPQAGLSFHMGNREN